jgi:hypothetical protein
MEWDRSVSVEQAAPQGASQTGGQVGNSRLTALTAAVLLVLLAVEGATLLALQSLLSVHIFVGMLLVPVVGLKLATTGYRFFSYYTGRRDYVAAGPPPILRRLTAPLLVLSTIALFATGVALEGFGPGRPLVLGLHKASFVVWVAAMTVHVLAHVTRVPVLSALEVRGGGGVAGSRVRLALLAAAVLVGALLAVATLPRAAPWAHLADIGD